MAKFYVFIYFALFGGFGRALWAYRAWDLLFYFIFFRAWDLVRYKGGLLNRSITCSHVHMYVCMCMCIYVYVCLQLSLCPVTID